MTSIALTKIDTSTRSNRFLHPLISVLMWELRRFRANRLFWVEVLGFFALVLFLIAFQPVPLTLNHVQINHVLFLGGVAQTSAWGLVMILPPGTVLVLGMLLPFVNTDGVARDRSRRTHELLLASALPTWAYVAGRYLCGLLLSLAVSLLVLVTLLGMGWYWHLTVANYPAPQFGTLLVFWVGMIASAAIVVSSLSFALGTLLPRLTTLVKIGLLLAWFVGSEVVSTALGNAAHSATFQLPAWYVNWDPTSEGVALGLFSRYMTAFSNLATIAADTAQTEHAVLTTENTVMDPSGWVVCHLLLAGICLLLVLIVAFVFKRSRTALS